jgi:23S rRNA pseudouridine1911/1915/1917 synthase
MIKPGIIYEDDSVSVIEKPSGWITNKASTTKDTPVLQTWISENLDYPISADDKFRAGIVHRLDKETSGIILLGKTKVAFKNLQRQFKNREVKKTYIALLHGELLPQKGSVVAPVGRLPWNRERFGVVPGGKRSETEYEVKKVIAGGEKQYSLANFFPKTGRTHQIRIHSKYMGHPIVGDSFYAGRKTSREDRKWCPRLFLHAQSISFMHPVKNKRMSFESKLPPDLNNVLMALEKGNIR